ncbi:MAG: HD domain-containing protein [Magnetococcales bacterium]|nr:HD domain-containing protein [Magnetococcales bacterium]
MKFSLNHYLLGVSLALDCVESELLGVTTNHGKRVAYVSMRMAQAMGLSQPEVFDIVAFALLHDNGLAEERLSHGWTGRDRLMEVEDLPAHCDIGEGNVGRFPFQSDHREIIRYHHERWDGGGFFGLTGDRIPIMAQIIGMVDYTDLKICFGQPNPENRADILAFLRERRGHNFSADLIEVFAQVSSFPAFWLDLRDVHLVAGLNRNMPNLSLEMSWERVLEVSGVFSRIIDAKSRFTHAHTSGLVEKTAFMADYYGVEPELKIRLRIAASLHDVGKLAIPNAILDKPGRLDAEERRKIEEHTYYTRICLESIPGFEEITEWAANHHEKLTGKGYPLGLGPERLDRWCRLLTVLDIYQALTEERPYRKSLSHARTMEIIWPQVHAGALDPQAVGDVERAFS